MNEISQGKVAFISFEEAEVGWKKEEGMALIRQCSSLRAAGSWVCLPFK